MSVSVMVGAQRYLMALVGACSLLGCLFAHAQPLPLPKGGAGVEPALSAPYPRTFSLPSGGRRYDGFAVGAPGPVRVSVQASGGPMTVALRRADGRVVERRGTGSVVIEDSASAADMKSGVLWGISISAAAGTPLNGQVMVEHPAADAAAIRAAWDQMQQQATARVNQHLGEAQKAGVDVQMEAKRSQQAIDQAAQARHAQAMQLLKTRIGVADLRLAPPGVTAGTAAAPGKGALVTPGATNIAATKKGVQSAKLSQPSSAPAGNTPPTNGSGGGEVVVHALSVNEGDPGTPVMIEGAGFGSAPGRVHFIVANGRDLVAPITFWSAQQIVTEVPMVDGVVAHAGQIYVQRADGVRSEVRQFGFKPAIESRMVFPSRINEWLVDDAALHGYALWPVVDSHGIAYIGHSVTFFGGNGDDLFFQTRRLRPGWVVAECWLTVPYNPTQRTPNIFGASSATAQCQPGSDRLATRVHWSIDWGSSVHYTVAIRIEGPKGVPHF